jgi:hypothetical protein
MQPAQTFSPFANRPRYWPSKSAWAAYLGTLIIALALAAWDAIHNNSPDTHPLQTDRLWLRIVGISFMVANFTIAAVAGFRIWRHATRLRNGFCLTCGYDLRASHGLCPECATPFQLPDPNSPPPTRWQRRIFKVFAIFDHWWFFLANAIAFTLAAILDHDLWSRLIWSAVALWDLYCLIRRIRKGPTDYEQIACEKATTPPPRIAAP